MFKKLDFMSINNLQIGSVSCCRRNVYRQGKSLESANLSEELLAGDSVMVYFERLKAPSLKVQVDFNLRFSYHEINKCNFLLIGYVQDTF
jgi:hypothetical protein